MSEQQLGRHYPVLLGKFITFLKAEKWPIADYSLFFVALSRRCLHLEHLHIRPHVFPDLCVPAFSTFLKKVSLRYLLRLLLFWRTLNCPIRSLAFTSENHCPSGEVFFICLYFMLFVF